MKYELLIIGGGPAGTAAGVYAARKKIKTALITKDFGGQSVVAADIQNWIGETGLSGMELAKRFQKHLEAQEGLEVMKGDLAVRIEKLTKGFRVETEKGKSFETEAILMANGASRRKLGVSGEEEFNGRGVAYCATCDAPLFNNKEVAVVGGGNSGLEAVRDLLSYANKIYLIVRRDVLKGDRVTADLVEKSDKVEIIFNSEVVSIEGDVMVKNLKYKTKGGSEEKELNVQGVFVEIGSVPNSGLVDGLVEINERGEIVVDHKTQRSSCLGIWAAGDVSDVLYKQNNISAGDAVKAVLNIYDWICGKRGS